MPLCVEDRRTVTTLDPSVTDYHPDPSVTSTKPLLIGILSLDCYVKKDKEFLLKFLELGGSVCYCNLASSNKYICGKHRSFFFLFFMFY